MLIQTNGLNGLNEIIMHYFISGKLLKSINYALILGKQSINIMMPEVVFILLYAQSASMVTWTAISSDWGAVQWEEYSFNAHKAVSEEISLPNEASFHSFDAVYIVNNSDQPHIEIIQFHYRL